MKHAYLCAICQYQRPICTQSAIHVVKVACLSDRLLEESLETEVDRILGRQRYVRRRRVKRKETGVYCSRCRAISGKIFGAMGITCVSWPCNGVE